MAKIYVGNLPFTAGEDEVRELFSKHGTVESVSLPTDRETGRPRGFAFVTFSTAEESKLAIEKMHGVDLDGRAITVNEARPKEENGGGGRSFSCPNRRAGAFQARGNSRY